ncbi:eukaryotic elongation factor 2 kinase-like isoform X1 [Branchiostoma lanceolatum]|uniref:eukaryotic elongation factor 2 kinase-like isoform X1 n=1 Tax=Branchiostoma lanceolatum TaxID=7740 RepID=UPI0034528E96
MSSVSSASDIEEDCILLPLTEIEVVEEEEESTSSDSAEEIPSSVSKQRRVSLASIRRQRKLGTLASLRPTSQPISIPAREQRQTPVVSIPVKNWRIAIQKAREFVKNSPNAWQKFGLEKHATEKATRHRYNALRKSWSEDTVLVKMEDEPFDHGAMRECFRLKKLSNFSRSLDWNRASNYVAKRYIEKVERDVYFEDVKLQMDAKLWGEEFNRHDPPKKVDIMQVVMLEFKDRPGSPLYHLEHFIEGKYIKYNSNSGFVEDESLRCTPQAFSHFTFERSSHNLIVVDIQGVGDLWTDPQIHTKEGTDYGDGNLGTKGMALYFHSHACNRICKALNLTPFDLSNSEIADLERAQFIQTSSKTILRGSEEIVIDPRLKNTGDITLFLRQRSESPRNSPRVSESEDVAMSTSVSPPYSPIDFLDDDPFAASLRRLRSDSENSSVTRGRVRYDSEMSDCFDDTMSPEEEAEHEEFARRQVSRPSCVTLEVNFRRMSLIQGQLTGGSVLGEKNPRVCKEGSILGRVHLEMAKYHENGRFAPQQGLNMLHQEEVDWDSAIFHLEKAAVCGVLEAIVALARMFLQLPHDVLEGAHVENTEENTNRGVDYMRMAAVAGDRSAMIYLANGYHTGIGLGTEREIDWIEATRWYSQAVSQSGEDEEGCYDATMEDPAYVLMAKEAELYRQGGHGLERDPERAAELYNEAAELAMAAMKGRLASKYFMFAEECWGEMEE